MNERCVFKNFLALKVTIFFIFLLLFVQWFYSFKTIADKAAVPQKNDVVLVFSNDPVRVPTGIRLAAKSKAAYLMVTDKGLTDFRTEIQQYGRPGGAKIILEGQAETTDQNARFTSEIIKKLPVQNVVLVTSWFHMPRALFLTRLYLLSTSIKVYPFPADDPPKGWLWSRAFWYEYVKLWGSLLRIGLSWVGVDHWPPHMI